MKPAHVLASVFAVLALASCSRDEEPSAAAPAPSAPPWSDATDAPVTPEPPPTVQPGAPTAATSAAVTTEVPERFRGEWNMELSACGTGMNDSRLVLGSNEIRFYETGGPVRRVEQPSPGELVVIAAVSGEGEGPEEQTQRFRLSADGGTLTTVGEGAPLVRKRCPAT